MGGTANSKNETKEIEKYSVLFLCVYGVAYGWLQPVWLFVRVTYLKTESFSARQDVEPWTLGRAAPSEPGLKQAGFVYKIIILPPPFLLKTLPFELQALDTRCSLLLASQHFDAATLSTLTFTGTKISPLFNQRCSNISWETVRDKQAVRDQHMIQYHTLSALVQYYKRKMLYCGTWWM